MLVAIIPFLALTTPAPPPQISSLLVAVLVAIFVGVTGTHGYSADDYYDGYDDGYYYVAPAE